MRKLLLSDGKRENISKRELWVAPRKRLLLQRNESHNFVPTRFASGKVNRWSTRRCVRNVPQRLLRITTLVHPPHQCYDNSDRDKLLFPLQHQTRRITILYCFTRRCVTTTYILLRGHLLYALPHYYPPEHIFYSTWKLCLRCKYNQIITSGEYLSWTRIAFEIKGPGAKVWNRIRSSFPGQQEIAI